MRMFYNIIGEVAEFCGFEHTAYRLYLAGFRHENR